MNAGGEAPLELVEAVASLRIPLRMDRRMQDLMDHNTDGSLTPTAGQSWRRLLNSAKTFPCCGHAL